MNKKLLVGIFVSLLIGISMGSAMGGNRYTYMGISDASSGGTTTIIYGGNVSLMGHNHSQDLNDTSIVTFSSIYGDGGNLTNISSAEGDPWFNASDAFHVTEALMANWNSSGTSLWSRSGTTLYTDTDGDAVQLNKTLDIVHTATESDDHTLELKVDAAGYGDVKALNIDYITGAIAMGQDEGVILLNIDEILATGGSVFGLEILATDGGSDIYGMKTGALIGPIHQDSGVFVNATTGTNNTPATDVPAMIDGAIGTTTDIFVADNEYIIVGYATAFEEMEFILTTSSSNPGIKPTFWYSTAGSGQFTQFTPVDGTNGFRNTGVVAWDQSDLTGHTTNDDTGTYDIKVIRTQNVLSTEPILGYTKVASTTEYVWDKDGNLSVNNINGNGSGVDVDWDKIYDMPEGFADGIDDEGAPSIEYADWLNQQLNDTDSPLFPKVNITNNASIFWEEIKENLTIDSLKNISFITESELGGGVNSINIDTDGIIDMRYQPGARVRITAAGQLVPSNTWTKLLLDIEDFDNNNDFAGYKFTVPKTGIYQICYSVLITELTDNDYLISAIYVNGVVSGGYELDTFSTATATDCANSGADIMKLDKNDYIELYVIHNFGAPPFSRLFASSTYSNYLAIQKVA